MLLDVALAPSARFVVGVNPVPDNDTVIGVLVALLAMARLPLNTPAALGANFTDLVHEAPPARMLPQLLVCVKPVLVVIEPIKAQRRLLDCSGSRSAPRRSGRRAGTRR